MMSKDKRRFAEVAAAHGLLNVAEDKWYGPFGMYGVERFRDGLLHAVGTGTLVSTIGVTDEVAEELLICWCPVAVEIMEMIEMGAAEEATNDGIMFVHHWDQFARTTKGPRKSAR